MKYRRILENGYSYFLTLVTHERKPLLIEHINLLRYAVKLSKEKYDYILDAIVILPDHIHMIITPEVATDYPKIITHIKRSFVYGVNEKSEDDSKSQLSNSKYKRKHSGIWQERYYEHTIRDEKDFKIRLDYIHFNPVKHQYVKAAKDWKYSSFNKFVKLGEYDIGWYDFESDIDFE